MSSSAPQVTSITARAALVLALTGTDPDRLREEKERGITIDLGFAHTTEQETVLSFVDVPGHERFVRNMLAGVGGMDLVMLHVAADESVMPQTREHFEICRLLQRPRRPRGHHQIRSCRRAACSTSSGSRFRSWCPDSFLEDAPVVVGLGADRRGHPRLRRTLANLASTARRRTSEGPPRLPIDRVFSMKGFGTVVTGTLLSGRLTHDDELRVAAFGAHGQGPRASCAWRGARRGRRGTARRRESRPASKSPTSHAVRR